MKHWKCNACGERRESGNIVIKSFCSKCQQPMEFVEITKEGGKFDQQLGGIA